MCPSLVSAILLVLWTTGRSDGLRYNYGDGSYYIGDVDANGKPSGVGQYFDSSEQLEYEGGYENGLPQGNGTWFGPNGEILEAEFFGGHAAANGIMTLKDGDLIEGSFRKHSPHGKVMIQRTNGERISGEFRHGMPHGRITWTAENGEKMEGSYRMGRPHGEIVVTNPEGEVIYAGNFVNGRAVNKDLPAKYHVDRLPFKTI